MCKRLIHIGIIAFCILPDQAFARGDRAINDWQNAIVGIGQSITDRDQSGSSWIVEYNSTFPATEIGLVLAPASYDRKRSSLNVVAICAPQSNTVVITEGRDFADFSSNRSINFNINASPPPNFVGGSLGAANASLSVDRSRSVNFSLSDTAVKQITESDAIDAVNATECVRKIKHRKDIFYVRGQYFMRLIMSQNRVGTGSFGASLGQTASNPVFGFGVRWNRSLEWEITQMRARPWFRIVSRFRRNAAGTAFEIVQ